VKLKHFLILLVLLALLSISLVALSTCENDNSNESASEAYNHGVPDDAPMNEDIELSNEKGDIQNSRPATNCCDSNMQTFNPSTIFVDLNAHTTTLGLNQIDPKDERFGDVLAGVMHGYTYFAFSEGEEKHLVVFSNRPNNDGDPAFTIGMDTTVHVKYDDEWHHAWFFSRQLALVLVAPITYFCWDALSTANALLVVGKDVGENYHLRRVTFQEGVLRVYDLIPQDPRPNWYLEWLEDNCTNHN